MSDLTQIACLRAPEDSEIELQCPVEVRLVAQVRHRDSCTVRACTLQLLSVAHQTLMEQKQAGRRQAFPWRSTHVKHLDSACERSFKTWRFQQHANVDTATKVSSFCAPPLLPVLSLAGSGAGATFARHGREEEGTEQGETREAQGKDPQS